MIEECNVAGFVIRHCRVEGERIISQADMAAFWKARAGGFEIEPADSEKIIALMCGADPDAGMQPVSLDEMKKYLGLNK